MAVMSESENNQSAAVEKIRALKATIGHLFEVLNRTHPDRSADRANLIMRIDTCVQMLNEVPVTDGPHEASEITDQENHA